jgi:hypothetical protein
MRVRPRELMREQDVAAAEGAWVAARRYVCGPTPASLALSIKL